MNGGFRIVLVGAGRIASQAHLPAILACDAARLAAIVDPVPERAAKLAREYGLSVRIFEKLEAALEAADGAIVATPNDTHQAIAATCLMRGVHVLVEKPMTSTYAEAQALSQLARDRGRVAMVGYVTRHRHNVRFLKSLLDQRHFGRVASFAYQFGTNGGWAPLAGYKADATGRGGVLAVSASHFLDRMLWFWGYPARMTYLDDGARGPEGNCLARFVFEGGMHGSLRCSKTAAMPGGLVLDTEMGHVILADTDQAEIVLLPRGQPGVKYDLSKHDVRPFLEIDPFNAQVSDFVAACQGKEGFGCDFEEGALSMRLMEDLYARRQALREDWYSATEVTEAQ